MKAAISIFFNAPTTEKNWPKIILWWELRRIPYNLFILIFISTTLLVISEMPNEGFIKIFAGPALSLSIYASLLLYFLGANLLFTLGWIVQIISRKLKHNYVHYLIRKSFIIGLIISGIVTLSPILIWLVNQILG